jgi:hypothetical protein
LVEETRTDIVSRCRPLLLHLYLFALFHNRVDCIDKPVLIVLEPEIYHVLVHSILLKLL